MTLAELTTAVGYRLGETITSSTIPTTTQVQSWLNEGMKKIVDKVNPIHLDELVTEYDLAAVGSTADVALATLTRYARPGNVMIHYKDDYSYSIPAMRISPINFKKALRGNGSFYEPTMESPVWTIEGGYIKFLPEITDAAEEEHAYITYIQFPADAGGLDDRFDQTLIDYATMIAKLQDEELADAQVFGQLFMEKYGEA